MNPAAADIAARRLRSQRLDGNGLEGPVEVVRSLGAVQSQDYPGAKWALAQRTRGWDSAALDRAFDAGEILRTHVLRPTWHFVAPEDLRWLLALTGPRVHAGNAGRYRRLELDGSTLRRGASVIVAALEGGEARTRQELGAALDAAGIPPTGQRLPHLLMHAELHGLICSGPRRGRQHTYVLLNSRAPSAPPLERDAAVAELVRRYFASHGPATVKDFAWWSGLTVADARRGLAAIGPDVERATVGRTTYWTANPDGTARRGSRPIVHLLPGFDELTVGYRDHAMSADPRAQEALAGWAGGVLGDVVALDGLVMGRWRRATTKTGLAVTVDLAIDLSKPERAALAQAVDRYGDFVGLPIALEGAAAS